MQTGLLSPGKSPEHIRMYPLSSALVSQLDWPHAGCCQQVLLVAQCSVVCAVPRPLLMLCPPPGMPLFLNPLSTGLFLFFCKTLFRQHLHQEVKSP